MFPDAIGNDIFLAAVDSAVPVGSITRQDNFFRVGSVSFHCLTSNRWDIESLIAGNAQLPDPTNEEQAYVEHPCAAISRILTNGNFYFSSTVDLSSSLETRLRRGSDKASNYVSKFLWNEYLLSSLLQFRSHLTQFEQDSFDRAGFLLMAIQGYVGTTDVHPGSYSGSSPLSISVFSRLSWLRAGTRFNARGVDDEGAVANYVETETLLRTDNSAMSYVQVRGSVPCAYTHPPFFLLQ